MARKTRLQRALVRTPQQARSRRTREEILKAAISCFEAKGYDQTTTAAIARKARVAVGTLYGYFTDKRAILLELLEGTTREISEYVVRNLDPSLWLGANLRDSVRAVIDALFHTRRIQPGIQRILWERYFKDPEFRKAVEAIEERVKAAMLNLFEALAERGQLRITDLQTAAFVIHATVEWTTSRVMLSGSEANAGPTVEALTDMICRYVFADEAVASSALALGTDAADRTTAVAPHAGQSEHEPV